MSWPAASLGGPFDLAESHVDFQSGRISDFVSQAFCGLKFLLSFYTRLGWYVYSVSHLSLKFDLRHTRFILTKQNIMVSSLHLSEYFAGYTFTGIISHISFFSSFFFFLRNRENSFSGQPKYLTPVNIPSEISHFTKLPVKIPHFTKLPVKIPHLLYCLVQISHSTRN